MRDIDGLYFEISNAFRFPDYFGNNFNALEECLTDMSWISSEGFLLVIDNGHKVLVDEDHDVLDGFFSVLHDSGEEWAKNISEGSPWDRQPKPFHTLIIFPPNTESIDSKRSDTIKKWTSKYAPDNWR